VKDRYLRLNASAQWAERLLAIVEDQSPVVAPIKRA
jgi:hypothetical protein